MGHIVIETATAIPEPAAKMLRDLDPHRRGVPPKVYDYRIDLGRMTLGDVALIIEMFEIPVTKAYIPQGDRARQPIHITRLPTPVVRRESFPIPVVPRKDNDPKMSHYLSCLQSIPEPRRTSLNTVLINTAATLTTFTGPKHSIKPYQLVTFRPDKSGMKPALKGVNRFAPYLAGAMWHLIHAYDKPSEVDFDKAHGRWEEAILRVANDVPTLDCLIGVTMTT